jgi:hypothetical protein|nr:MAG TPA: hypothetical protein [Caudoviricetes sp.]
MDNKRYTISMHGKFSIEKDFVAQSKEDAYALAEEFLDELYLSSMGFDDNFDSAIYGDIDSIEEVQDL